MHKTHPEVAVNHSYDVVTTYKETGFGLATEFIGLKLCVIAIHSSSVFHTLKYITART
jgi:hypothetical protein